MAPFKKKQRTLAEIVLASKPDGDTFNSSSDHFLSHETVTGTAIFTLGPDVKFDHSKITLKGSIQTTTEDAGATVGGLTKGWRTEKLPFLGVLFESKATAGLGGVDHGVVKIPFRFNLNECEKLAAFTSHLPPSINSKTDGQRSSDPQYEITYSITATAFSSRATLASAIQRIYIDPVSPDSMSDTSSDIAGEYFWAQKGMARSQSLRPEVQAPKIELAAQEPPAIILDAEDLASNGSTEVPFIVKVLPRDDERLSRETFPRFAVIKSQLVTKTHMTPDGIKGISSLASLDYIKVDGKTTTKVQYSHKQDHKIPISKWERSVSDQTEDFSVARFSFVFKLDGGKLPLASFYTPLLSRRYLIDLTLSFDGSNETFQLSLPCEIVHGSADASDYYEEQDRKKSDTSVTVNTHPPVARRTTDPGQMIRFMNLDIRQ